MTLFSLGNASSKLTEFFFFSRIAPEGSTILLVKILLTDTVAIIIRGKFLSSLTYLCHRTIILL